MRRFVLLPTGLAWVFPLTTPGRGKVRQPVDTDWPVPLIRLDRPHRAENGPWPWLA